MIPSIEITELVNQIQTVQEYASLDTGEFNGKCNDVQRRIVELAEMLDENGE